MRRNDYQLDELRAAIADAEACVPSVSRWSVGRHVGHCALAANSICRALVRSEPPPPRSVLPWRATVLLLTGRIPRGRAQAPDAVVPEEQVSPPELLALLEETAQQLEAVQALDRRAWFKHFALGVLTRDRALRFLRVHNRHHAKIIADILRRR